ncbi:MAG: class I SAM-dependent methyltransferase [Rhodospirillales bacterium]
MLTKDEFAKIANALAVPDGEKTTGYPGGTKESAAEKKRDINRVLDTVADDRSRDNIRCIQGRIPESLSGYENVKWRLVHLDLDLYAPTKNVLSFVWPRLVPGGIIAVHDYQEVNFIGGRRATDEFADRHGLTPIVIPDVWGTAVLIKPLSSVAQSP